MSSPPFLEKRISSLVKLMDDRDEFVRSRVREELIRIGEDAVPFLEIAVRNENLSLRTQAQAVLKDLLPVQLEKHFQELLRPGQDINLEDGVMLLMQFGYPDASPAQLRKSLNELAAELAPRIQSDSSPEKVVEILTQFLFHEKKFTGNKEKYFTADNTYLNKVLLQKSGIPISLSVLCIFIANRIAQPIVGVGLPCHFIVKYNSPGNPIYFDPFHEGRLLNYEDCVQLVNNFGIKFENHFLCQSSNREILIRMINNLIMIYKRENQNQKSEQLIEYVNILNGRRK